MGPGDAGRTGVRARRQRRVVLGVVGLGGAVVGGEELAIARRYDKAEGS